MKRILSLNGKWNFRYKNKKVKIDVPCNWYLLGHDIYGKAEYARDFFIYPVKDKKYYILFNGVDYFADVYINGKFAGFHEGYFQKFRFDITSLLKQGNNTVKVLVNSPKETGDAWPDRKFLIKGIFNHHDARPGSWNKEFGQDKNTGGIWNSVEIIETGKIEIERVKITPVLKEDGVWNSNHELRIINNNSEPVEAVLSVMMKPFNFKGSTFNIKRKVRLNRGLNTVNVSRDLKNPGLWWSWDYGKPNLYSFCYEVKSGKETDKYYDIAGVRELKLNKEDNRWYLNGKRIFLRGSNIIPTQWLSEYTMEKIEKDALLIKQANMNMVRIHAHVNREELYRELDRQGIMVWQDFALQWGYRTTNEFMENACRQIKDMVNIHYNRPSIVIWCCHNEPFINERQLDPVLFRKAKEEDAVRHIEQASDFSQHHYQGWYYDDTFTNALATYDIIQKAGIVTEYGAQALPCLETMKKTFKTKELWPPKWKKWEYHDFQYRPTIDVAGVKAGKSIREFISNSQKYQADLIKEQTEVFRQRRDTSINGILHFMLADCWPSITWSVVDYFRKPKLGYEYLKTAFQPVLPGFRLMTTKVSQGAILGFGLIWKMIWIINDSHSEIKNAEFEIRLRNPKGRVYFRRNKKAKIIKADSYSFPFDSGLAFDNFDGDKFKVPKKAQVGKHRLEVDVKRGGKVLGSNFYEFEVARAVKLLSDQYT